MWIKPVLIFGYSVAAMWATPYKTWLQIKVPAVFETLAGILPSLMCSTIALIGRVEKYAAGPSSATFSSIGWLPSLSLILQSSQLMPTLSTVMSGLPPAWPIDKTTSGFTSSIFCLILSTDFPITVGISSLIISAPLISSGNFFTDSMAGLMDSPPNGSNPVTKIFIKSLLFQSKNQILTLI